MSRRRLRAAQAALTAALAVIVALAGTSAAGAATPRPAPSPSGTASSGTASAQTAASPALATFGLAAASGDLPDVRGWIDVKAAPGSVVFDRVAVVNQSDGPLNLDVYSADAENAADGSLGLPDRSVRAKDAGSWIAVGAARVSVPPQSSAGVGRTIVPLTITIPPDAEPGEHVAGVVASLTATGSASNGQQTTDVDLEQRVGLRLYVTVTGPTHAGLRISALRATYHPAAGLGLAGPGSTTVTYTLTNTGNVRLAVEPTVSSSGVLGLGRARAAGQRVDELLPKASLTQTVELTSTWPLVLDHVQVRAAVTLPGEARDAGIGVPSAGTWMWAVPWAYLVAIALIVLAWWWLRRRSGRARRSRGVVAAPPPSTENGGVDAAASPVPALP